MLSVETGDALALRSVRVAKAKELYACVDDGATSAVNVAIALAAADLRPRERNGDGGLRRDFSVYAHVSDARLRLSLQAQSYLRPQAGPAVRRLLQHGRVGRTTVRGVGRPSTSALARHIVVAGASLVRPGRRGGAGPAVVPRPAQRPAMAVTLIDIDADEVRDELLDRWSVVQEQCELTALRGDPERALQTVVAAPYRAYFCFDDEDLALRLGFAAAVRWQGGKNSVVVRLNRSGLAARPTAGSGEPELPGQDLLDDVEGRLRLVTAVDLAAVEIVDETGLVERLARFVHENYLNWQVGQGVARGAEPAMVSWDRLSDDFRRSNRAQARDSAQEAAHHRVYGGSIVEPCAQVRVRARRGREAGHGRARTMDAGAQGRRLAVRCPDAAIAASFIRAWCRGTTCPRRSGRRTWSPRRASRPSTPRRCWTRAWRLSGSRRDRAYRAIRTSAVRTDVVSIRTVQNGRGYPPYVADCPDELCSGT